MSIDVEYAIKKDIRNNPVIREIDLEQKREFLRTAGLAALVVAMLLFSAWQHFKIVQHGYGVEDLRELIAAEESVQRKLRLQLETDLRPQEIASRAATELGMVAPAPGHVVIIERIRPAVAARAVVAEVR